VSLDLGSPIIEVALGLSFVFFLLSLGVTWITEGIARWTNKRAKTLEKGLTGLLGSQTFAAELFNHPLVQTDVKPAGGKKDPSYVSSRNFALALVSLLKEKGKDAGGEGDTIAQVRKGVAVAGGAEDGVAVKRTPMGVQLDALLDEIGIDGDLAAFRKSTEKWFDDAMDRVSGWYTRWAKKITLIVAIAIAIGLNASALRIADRLIDDPTVRAAVVAGAEKSADGGKDEPKASGEATQTAVEELKSLQVPILWPKDNLPVQHLTLEWRTLSELALTLIGWAITAFAISLGAPFWFDALSKISRVRSTGKKPEPSGVDPEPAAPQTLKLEVSQEGAAG
jgi:hypothetical protein